MVVKLSSRKNPDFKNDPTRNYSENITVMSLQQARDACQRFIATNDLGGGNWTGGQVFFKNGKQVARISYNGRVWDMEEKEIIL